MYVHGAVSRPHFRAHERRPVRLAVGLVGPRSAGERAALVVDISLAGAAIETDETLVPGDRVSVSFQTPTLWDPLVLSAVVAWAEVPRAREPGLPIGKNRPIGRAGIAFDYPAPDIVLALFEMLATLDYE